MRPWVAGLAVGFVMLLSTAGAQAHGISPAISGFYAGGLLVLMGPDDVLKWIALCAFAATHKPDRAGWVAEALVSPACSGVSRSAGWGWPD